ncbi:AMP-binding protein [Kineococcus gynurae]|uniref:AMP-binding protein n=1 Tax=Kineococcus gynurae TaxID=452979 RepID=A0ABV5LR75_9ACTN
MTDAPPEPLVLAGPARAVLEGFLAGFGGERVVVVTDPTRPASWQQDLLDRVRRATREGRVRPGDAVLLTGGTTGNPRAVVRDRASWVASAPALATLLGLRPTDEVWVPGPPTSTLSLQAAWHAEHCGTEVVGFAGGTAAPPARATVLHGVPSALRAALEARAAGRMPALRVAVVAGDTCPPTLVRRAGELGVDVVEYYGAAELSFVAYRDTRTVPPVAGFAPFPGAEVRVRDGRVEVCSAFRARGYLPGGAPGMPGPEGPLTETVDADGRVWAGVGDGGRWVDGRLHLTGRDATAVTTGGWTVLTADVEAVLGEVEGVLGVVVHGRPHPDLGAVLVAVVETAATTTKGRADLRRRLDAAARELSAPARPRRWSFVARLPRTPAGKTDRAAAALLDDDHR